MTPARTGTTVSPFSGDLFFAGSIGNPTAIAPGFRTLYPEACGRCDQLRFIPWGYLDPLFEAVVQASEEAVLNSIVANEEMVGYQGHRSPALPRERVVAILRQYARVQARRSGRPYGRTRDRV